MIVFLDIDGVLNSTAWAGQRPLRGFIPPSTAAEAFEDKWIDPATVARLRTVIERTGASIVVMSSWRHQMTVAEFVRLLELHGWITPPVIGVTPDLPGSPRGMEVETWLAGNGVHVRYVCVDDDADFMPHQAHVQTDPDVGLTDEDVRRCVNALTNTNW